MLVNHVQVEPDSHHKKINSAAFVDYWQQLEVGDVRSLLVTGFSMRPFLIHNQSVVFIRKVVNPRLKKGDVVLFRRANDAIVLHRIVQARKDGTFIVNGDGQNWTEVMMSNQVMAKVTKICRTKRIVSADNVFYRGVVHIWLLLRPVRPYLSWLHRKIRFGKH